MSRRGNEEETGKENEKLERKKENPKDIPENERMRSEENEKRKNLGLFSGCAANNLGGKFQSRLKSNPPIRFLMLEGGELPRTQ
jgi:hypothetical protein